MMLEKDLAVYAKPLDFYLNSEVQTRNQLSLKELVEEEGLSHERLLNDMDATFNSGDIQFYVPSVDEPDCFYRDTPSANMFGSRRWLSYHLVSNPDGSMRYHCKCPVKARGIAFYLGAVALQKQCGLR